jgi:iron complex outermembrane receptor protein
VYYGEYDEGDGETTRAEATIGGSGDRFSAVFSISYGDQSRVSAADREQSREPVPGTGVTQGSSATPQGRFIFTDPRTGNTVNLALNNGTATPVYDPANPTSGTSTYNPFDNSDRFNFAPFNLVLTPSERKSIFTSVRYDLTDSVQWYIKGLYNTRNSINQAAPEPLFLGSDAGTGGLADTVSVSRLNPFNPFGIDLISGDNFFFLGRRPLEGGPRIYNQDVDTFYISTGLQGTFNWSDRIWSWDLNYVNSENKAEQTQQGNYNVRHIQQALGDPALCAAIPGCTPLNLFGGQGANGQGTITPEMLAFVQYNAVDISEQDLELVSANVTGDIFELPAGPLGFAIGYEWRDYEGFFQPDALKISGESNDVLAQPSSGSYDVSEFYAEINVPIVTNLDLSLAGRYSDYSTFGGETTGKAGLRWQPVEDLVLRGTYAEGFRAPSIGELFGSPSRFDATLTDPCSGNVTANCTALGVPPGYQQLNPQISVTTGGSPDLQPENADSFNLGFVYSPTWAEGVAGTERFDIGFTYYDHEIEDAIAPVDAQFRLNRCVETLDPQFCDGITRTPSGQINAFNNQLVNLGTIETDGWDLRLDWLGPDTGWGRFGFSWSNTFVNDYERIGASGAPEPQEEGREVNDSSIPEWTSNLQITWALTDWTVGWTIRHIDELTESCGGLQAFGICSDPAGNENRLGSTTYNDFQVGWNNPFGVENLRFTAGLNNAFDEDPPICLSCSLNGYDASTYDVPGQFWYVQMGYKF